MATQAKSSVVHVRIPNELLKKIKLAALAEDRPASQMVLRILKQWAAA